MTADDRPHPPSNKSSIFFHPITFPKLILAIITPLAIVLVLVNASNYYGTLNSSHPQVI
jgi:hypothetical protein